jgi:hypothetical protein
MSNAKDAASRQRRNLPAIMSADGVVRTIPNPPPRMPRRMRVQWAGLWTSPVGALLDPVSDWPAAARLFELLALGDRIARQIAKAPEIETALVSARIKCATEARLIESQLGLSPRSRLALGLALLAGRRGSGGEETGTDGHDDAND